MDRLISWWRRRPSLLSAVTASVLSTLPYVSVLVGRSSGIYEDTLDQYLPRLITVWRAIKNGHAPWWSPLQYAGLNLLGSGQAGIFYPPNALFGIMSPIAAHRWWLVIHVWIAASGAAWWSWNRWRHRPAAVVSGVAYALCGFMVLHLQHMVLFAGAAWLPWALLGVDRLLERWTLRYALLVAIPTAMCGLVGHPQGLWQLLVAIVISAGIQAIGAPVSGLGSAALRFVRPIGAALIGVGIGAIQLLPQFLLGRTSVRPTLSRAEAFTFADAPHHLMTTITPWLFGGNSTLGSQPWREPGLPPHEYISYLGITALALAVVGIISLRKDPRSISLVVLAVIGALTALAGHTPFGAITYHLVPFARSFRAWSRNVILISVAISSLTGAGVRAIRLQPKRWTFTLAMFSLAAGATFVLNRLAMLHDERLVTGRAWIAAVGLPLLLVCGLTAAVRRLAERPWVIAAVLIAFVSLDMIVFSLSAPWRSSQKPNGYVEWALGDGASALGGTYDAPGGIDRWHSDDQNTRAWSLTRNTPGVIGYDPLLQRNVSEVASLDYRGQTTGPDFWLPTRIADLFRVTTLYLKPQTIPSDPAWTRDPSVGTIQHVRYTRTPRLPEAYVVGDVRSAPLDSILAMLRTDPRQGPDLLHTAFVEPSGPNSAAALSVSDAPKVAGSATGSMRSDGQGRYEVVAARSGLLVVSYSWLPGWTARVDNSPAPVTRVNGVLLGVPVPAGSHTVTLQFRPPGLRLGALAALLSIIALFTPAAAIALRNCLHSRQALTPER